MDAACPFGGIWWGSGARAAYAARVDLLVTGARGMLGRELVDVLAAAGHRVTAAGRGELDVTDAAAVRAAVPGHDGVVNAAAWTAVDAAEDDEAGAAALNEAAPGLLAAAAREAGAAMVHVSTDYVFDGTARDPWSEDAPTAPASAYGRTKAAGERAVRAAHPGAVVVRTAWLYGDGACFPRTIARAAATRAAAGERLPVVDDQVGQPTWSRDVAAVVADLLGAGAPAGTYHATSSGRVSWCGFARAVVGAAGLDPGVVVPTGSAAFVRPAPRPAFSVLGHDALRRAGLAPIGPWEQRWALAAPAVLAPLSR